ncbi:DUF4347 domain-containing protein [Xanthomarina sp. F2636L]|uniref:DUF4347 domain-containing protein n=1 Tax=Xanthomarina sp. F2636L TaxID=2996018 RepID=UPI00225E4882|nr:DUF4347 domain-containing protein [Xanthomarina sp. F2636L]MCX7549634.1 DUF4347 domain-containing protein [Xanthomarina sp. F2636L]
MKPYPFLILLILILGCKKPFSQTPETALAIPIAFSMSEKSIVFIAGYDEGDNSYYTQAKNYFKAQNIQVIDNLFSMAEIIDFLNKDTRKTYDKIHIVSHSNPWMGISLKTTKNGERLTVESLSKAKNNMPTLNHAMNNASQIIFHSCGIGENKDLLLALKQLFITEESTQTPQIIASSYFNVFGGKYAGHYLAKPYYGYYPTAESPGPTALSKDFKASYPNTNIDWFTALKTRKETTLGNVYSYKFNIPVEWEFTFDDKADIPEFTDREAIMDWVSESPEMASILYKLNIPLEKYRWKSDIRGNKLIIKGKTTVLCVLEPILQKNDTTEYKSPIVSDTSLYQIL